MLRGGRTRSCGCLRKETSSVTGKKAKTHGHRSNNETSTEYRSWRAMRRRCRDSNNPQYVWYGGRGIKICKRWDSFENFIDDMGRKPSPELSIDRIDNSGDYEPGNCRWATMREQQRNRRSNKTLTCGGETLVLKEWSERTGIKYPTLKWRVSQGWSVERVLGLVN